MTRRIIYVAPADEIQNKFPHGQFHFLVPGVILNFACPVDDRNVGDTREMAQRLVEFLASDEPLLEFDSPHLPGRVYMTRYAASQVASVQSAWSDKVMPKVVDDGENGTELRQSASGLPLIRATN